MVIFAEVTENEYNFDRHERDMLKKLKKFFVRTGLAGSTYENPFCTVW